MRRWPFVRGGHGGAGRWSYWFFWAIRVLLCGAWVLFAGHTHDVNNMLFEGVEVRLGSLAPLAQVASYTPFILSDIVAVCLLVNRSWAYVVQVLLPVLIAVLYGVGVLCVEWGGEQPVLILLKTHTSILWAGAILGAVTSVAMHHFLSRPPYAGLLVVVADETNTLAQRLGTDFRSRHTVVSVTTASELELIGRSVVPDFVVIGDKTPSDVMAVVRREWQEVPIIASSTARPHDLSRLAAVAVCSMAQLSDIQVVVNGFWRGVLPRPPPESPEVR